MKVNLPYDFGTELCTISKVDINWVLCPACNGKGRFEWTSSGYGLDQDHVEDCNRHYRGRKDCKNGYIKGNLAQPYEWRIDQRFKVTTYKVTEAALFVKSNKLDSWMRNIYVNIDSCMTLAQANRKIKSLNKALNKPKVEAVKKNRFIEE